MVKVAWLWRIIPQVQVVMELGLSFRAYSEEGLQNPFVVFRRQALRPQAGELK